MVKHYKRAALVAAMALASSGAMAQGLDSAESKLYANYVTDDMLLNADKDASNWLLYGRDYQTTRYSPLAQINQGNIKKMKATWNLSFGVLDGQDSQTVVVNGTVYVTSSYNKVWAVDGATGKVNWKYERELPGDVFPKLCCDVVNRGVAVAVPVGVSASVGVSVAIAASVAVATAVGVSVAVGVSTAIGAAHDNV